MPRQESFWRILYVRRKRVVLIFPLRRQRGGIRTMVVLQIADRVFRPARTLRNCLTGLADARSEAAESTPRGFRCKRALAAKGRQRRSEQLERRKECPGRQPGSSWATQGEQLPFVSAERQVQHRSTSERNYLQSRIECLRRFWPQPLEDQVYPGR